MAISVGNNGEMSVLLTVKDDGSVVVEKFGEKSEEAFDKSGKAADKNTKRLSKNQKELAKLKKEMKLYGAAIAAVAAVIVTAAVRAGAGFEQSMANVQSVAGATRGELESLTQAARDQAKVSVFSASQAADAQYFLASAGLEVNQIISAQSGVMALAAATQSDLSRTSEITTATLAQFSLQAEEADRVANVFAATISGSQATMQKLGDAMRYVGPVANSLEVDLESTTAAIALLFNAGFKGEQAGTVLRASLIALQKPSAEAATLIDQMGLRVNDANGKFVGFESLIEQLADKQITLNEAATLFGAEAAPGMIAMIKQGAEEYRKLRTQITGTNKAQEMANQQTDTLTGDWKLFKSALEESFLVLYEDIGPAIRAVVQSMTELVQEMDYSLPGWEVLGGTMKTVASIAVGLKTTFLELGTAIGGVAAATVAFFSGNFSQAKDILVSMKNDVAQIHAEANEMIDNIWGKKKPNLKEGARAGGGADALPSPGATDSPDAALAGRGTREAGETEKLRTELTTQVELLTESWMNERELLFSRYADEQFLLEEALAAKAITQEEYQSLMLQSTAAYEQELTRITLEGQSEQYRLWESGWKGKLKVTSGILGMLSNLMQSENKKQFEIGKKAAIAKTLVDTYTGAVGAYQALASIPIVGPALGAAAALAMVMYGKSQVSAIKKQQFQGGGTVGTPTFNASPNTGQPSTGSASSFDTPSPFGTSQQASAPRVSRTVVLQAQGSIDPSWMRDVFIPQYNKAKADGADVDIMVAT